ncbi:MAG TPA: hypothetical protein VGO80_04855 [Solirubrobacteraceae bacterium]|nr:hypothetical protein [Solirubrobacteraceae bacterium]
MIATELHAAMSSALAEVPIGGTPVNVAAVLAGSALQHGERAERHQHADARQQRARRGR